MAIKIIEQKKNEVAVPAAPVPHDDTVVLELSLYKQYNFQGTLYVEKTGYRFTKDNALILMSERDAGRPIWKLFRPVVKKAEVKNIVIDSTQKKIQPLAEPIPGTVEHPKSRIDVGDDSEIDDILGQEAVENDEEVPI